MFAPGPLSEVDHDVFIVHAEDDTPFVKGELLAMLGVPLDRAILSSELPFPGFTEQVIEDAVRRSQLTLAIVSPAYLRDRWAGFAELLSRNVRDDGRGGSLVPLLVADCDAPAILAQHEVLDCRTPQRCEASTARLRARLGRPDPAVEPIACPYPGMQPFSAATSAQFHGRTKEIDEILGRLEAGEREIFVVGPSGSGKSSLVAAGIIPRLQAARARLGGLRFAVRSLRPGEHPTQRLVDAGVCDLERLAGAPDRLLEREHCDRLLIFLDQFEELFALAGAEERGQFFRVLRVLRADRRCHLIIALRADFYGALMSSELWPDIDGRFTRLEVAPLRGDALRAAIEAPAREAGVYLERALVERLMTDAAAEPGALPLLQEALVLLWARRSHRLLRLASYEQLGSEGRSGLAVALARRADAILHDLTPPQQVLARRILLRLVSFGEGRPDTRRQQPRAALSGSGEDAARVDEVIDRLIDDRMLTSNATATGERLIDLAHEALITGWPELQRWLLTRRDDEQRRRVLELHVAEWVKRGRGTAGLFDAIELAEAERWIAAETARELGHSADLPQFLAASRAAIEDAERARQRAHEKQARERQAAADERAQLRRRLGRFAILIFTLFSIVASIFGVVAWRQRQEVQRQYGRNELDWGRLLLVDRRDLSSAIPHLVQAARLGVDNAVLRTLIAETKHELWRVAIRDGRPVNSAAFSPDGSRVLTVSDDGTTRVWDAATGAPLSVPLKDESVVDSAAFSPDGSRIVTASWDGTARVRDAATGVPLGVPLKHERKVNSAAFSPDGSRVVTASDDGTARVWDAATGAPLGVPLMHGERVLSAAFSPDGSRVVAVSGYITARIWNAATGAALGVTLEHEGQVNCAVFSPDGSRVVTASDDGTARVWDAATGAPLGVPLKHQRKVKSAAFSPDGSRVVTVSDDSTARMWDAATGEPLGVPLKHERKVNSAAFSPDSSRIVTASDDGTARVWDAATGAPLGLPLKHERKVHGAAFSPDGSRVVTASDDGTARIWNATPLGVLLKHERKVHSAAFSPDGSCVVTVDDSTARIWNAATGAPLGVPISDEQPISSAAFSPDGSRVATVRHDNTARVWDAATGSPLGVHQKDEQWNDAFRRDGSRVVAASLDATARASVSPDGSRVVTISNDGTARICDSATKAPFGLPLKHEREVHSAAFSPDGSRVVTASLDGTARIWDAATGAPIGLPLQHEREVNSAAFSPDGSRVVTASNDGTARIWNVVETSALSSWVDQMMRCIVPDAGSWAVCSLWEHEIPPSEFLPRARSLMAAGDTATFSLLWAVARAHYEHAVALLNDTHPRSPRFADRGAEDVRGIVSRRLAMLDVLEGHLEEAHGRLGPDAPATDVLLLNTLGGVAHDEIKNDVVALRLMLRVYELNPKDASTLANLAEVYFAAGQYDELARCIAKLDKLQTSSKLRVTVAALAWAAARLTRTPSGDRGARFLRAYQELANGAQLEWSWAGTKHALKYGHLGFDAVKPVLHVIAVLEQPVADETRSQLAELLEAPNPSESQTK